VASFPKTGCCCFVDQDKLVCVDAFTGKTLWARTKDDKHTQFVGNGSQLVTTDSKQTVFSAFDIRTGERIRTGKISDFTEALWIVDGTSFVSFSIKPQSHLGKLDALVDYQPDVEEESKKEEESDNTTTTKQTSSYGRKRLVLRLRFVRWPMIGFWFCRRTIRYIFLTRSLARSWRRCPVG